MQHAAYIALTEARECLARVQTKLLNVTSRGGTPIEAIPYSMDLILFAIDEEIREIRQTA